MQKELPEGIVIACDYCGVEWDEVRTMIEGHRGSVICLDCFRKALVEAKPAEMAFTCTLCQQPHEADTRAWLPPQPPPGMEHNPDAAICWDCVRLAAKTFHKDKDTDFRWDPSEYPGPLNG